LTIYLLFPYVETCPVAWRIPLNCSGAKNNRETKGKTLEEQDEFFKNTPWIVPLIKQEKVSSTQREAELRHRKSSAFLSSLGLLHLVPGGELS
jgi:hypothetical protein